MSSLGETRQDSMFIDEQFVASREGVKWDTISWWAYYFFLVCNDVFMTGAAFRIAYWIRFQLSIPIFEVTQHSSLAYYGRLVIFMLPAWIVVFALMGLYRRKNLLGGTQEYALIWRGTTLSLLLIIVIGFLEPDILIARGFLLVAWFMVFIFVATGRFILRRFVYRLRNMGLFLVPAIIIGGNMEGRLLAQQILDWKSSGLRLCAILSKKEFNAEDDFGQDILEAPFDRVDEIVEKLGVREMIIATSDLTRDEMLTIFRKYGISDLVNLRLSSGLFEIITTGLQVKELAYIPLVSIQKVRLTGLDLFLKLVVDYSGALAALFFLSPLLVILSILIKLDSPGPVLHRRRVMGLNRRQFDAFKFRTMHVNADEILASDPDLRRKFEKNHKLQDDPRVTRVGKFLRRFSLDELPQFVNVLRGEMSIVGPRMISPEEMAKYTQWGINLLTVKPGITGLWQVSGRSDVSYDQRVKLDMYYIRNWSFWFDLYLLLQTIPAVFRAKGAY